MSRLFQSRQWTKVKIKVPYVEASSSAMVEPLAATEIQWEKAKSYKAIPGPSTLSLVRGFAPGGMCWFCRKNLKKIVSHSRKYSNNKKKF
jgi:hypothetical protein